MMAARFVITGVGSISALASKFMVQRYAGLYDAGAWRFAFAFMASQLFGFEPVWRLTAETSMKQLPGAYHFDLTVLAQALPTSCRSLLPRHPHAR